MSFGTQTAFSVVTEDRFLGPQQYYLVFITQLSWDTLIVLFLNPKLEPSPIQLLTAS